MVREQQDHVAERSVRMGRHTGTLVALCGANGGIVPNGSGIDSNAHQRTVREIRKP